MICPVQPDSAVIARNLRSAMGAYARSTDRGATLDLGAAGVFCSGVDYAVFNAVVLTEPVSRPTLAEMLDRCADFYGERGVGWSCWLDESMVDPDDGIGAADLLKSRGMQWVAEHEGMLTSRIRADRRRLPDLAVRPVSSQDTRDDFINVCCQVFLLPPAITRRVYGAAPFWDGVMRGWVGYQANRPVCIAVSAVDNGSVGLYSVGTVPGFRGRGYGEFITRHAINEAADRSGLARWSLQSTPAGLPLYRRIGYESRTRISVWATE